jgi:hypothetical protein
MRNVFRGLCFDAILKGEEVCSPFADDMNRVLILYVKSNVFVPTQAFRECSPQIIKELDTINYARIAVANQNLK